MQLNRRDIYTQCPFYCSNTVNNDTALLPTFSYICGDTRLGPKMLPTDLPLSTLIGSYQRFGGLCPGDWLKLWTDKTTGKFVYPPLDGFEVMTNGKALFGNVTLLAGTRVDRFGSEYGTYASLLLSLY